MEKIKTNLSFAEPYLKEKLPDLKTRPYKKSSNEFTTYFIYERKMSNIHVKLSYFNKVSTRIAISSRPFAEFTNMYIFSSVKIVFQYFVYSIQLSSENKPRQARDLLSEQKQKEIVNNI